MKTTQPFFEKFKVITYNFLLNMPEAKLSLLGGRFISIHKKETEFKEDLNKFLDSIDIREVSSIVKELSDKGAKFPAWMKNNEYSIEYNKHDNLDLTRDTTC